METEKIVVDRDSYNAQFDASSDQASSISDTQFMNKIFSVCCHSLFTDKQG